MTSSSQNEWRPIESAPKDGTRFLAFGGGLDAVESAYWSADVGCWCCESVTLDDLDDEMEGYCRPAHWMPLPQPPAESGAAGRQGSGANTSEDRSVRDEHSPPSPAHTPSLGGLDLDALEKVAREALANKPHAQAWETHLGTLVRHASPAYSEHVATARAAQVAEHIAAFDPPTVLRLIELARAAPPQPEPRDGALETATVEAVAQAIYEQWADQEGYVPWVPRGNSLKQEDARDLARKALSARDGASEGGALDREAVALDLLEALKGVMALRDRGFTKAVARDLGLEVLAATTNGWFEEVYRRARAAISNADAALASRPAQEKEL